MSTMPSSPQGDDRWLAPTSCLPAEWKAGPGHILPGFPWEPAGVATAALPDTKALNHPCQSWNGDAISATPPLAYVCRNIAAVTRFASPYPVSEASRLCSGSFARPDISPSNTERSSMTLLQDGGFPFIVMPAFRRWPSAILSLIFRENLRPPLRTTEPQIHD